MSICRIYYSEIKRVVNLASLLKREKLTFFELNLEV